MRAPVVLAFALACAPLVAACSGVFNTTSQPEPMSTEPVQLPGPADAPPLARAAGEPEDLPGIDASQLSHRERDLFWRLVTQLYAPCSDQAVSLAACVKEQRACVACVPAVQLLIAKIHEGALAEQAQTAYGERFGPKVKQVDLADSPSKGPENAPVTIVEWFDFECPHCKLAAPMLEKIYEKHAGQVRLVKKFFPLRAHARAEPAAQAAVAAQNQGKFWEYERVLFAHTGDLGDADLLRYAADLKLDVKRFQADMTSERTLKIVARDKADAERFGLTGTPFIIINGREFDLGLFHLEGDLEPWIDLEVRMKAGARATTAR